MLGAKSLAGGGHGHRGRRGWGRGLGDRRGLGRYGTGLGVCRPGNPDGRPGGRLRRDGGGNGNSRLARGGNCRGRDGAGAAASSWRLISAFAGASGTRPAGGAIDVHGHPPVNWFHFEGKFRSARAKDFNVHGLGFRSTTPGAFVRVNADGAWLAWTLPSAEHDVATIFVVVISRFFSIARKQRLAHLLGIGVHLPVGHESGWVRAVLRGAAHVIGVTDPVLRERLGVGQGAVPACPGR